MWIESLFLIPNKISYMVVPHHEKHMVNIVNQRFTFSFLIPSCPGCVCKHCCCPWRYSSLPWPDSGVVGTVETQESSFCSVSAFYLCLFLPLAKDGNVCMGRGGGWKGCSFPLTWAQTHLYSNHITGWARLLSLLTLLPASSSVRTSKSLTLYVFLSLFWIWNIC